MDLAGSALARDAATGARAWGAFAVVETAVAQFSPWLDEHPAVRTGPDPLFSALILVLYPLTGLVAGVVAGWLLRRLRGDSETVGIWAVGSVLATFVVALALQARTHPAQLSPVLPFVLAVALALAVSITSRRRARRYAFLTGPWTVASLLGVLPWIAFENPVGAGWAGATTVLLAGALVLGTSFVRRGRRRSGAVDVPRSVQGPRLLPTAVSLLAVLALVLLAPAPTPPGADEAFGGAPDGAADLPHVVLITLDTVRADHLSLYGYERATSPFLETLARESTVYTRAFASGAMTLSTHASIFTGLYAGRHGAHNTELAPEGAPLEEGLPTLAEALTEAGYATVGVASNVGYLSPAFGLDRGFLYYDSREPRRFLALGKRYQLRRAVRNVLALFERGERSRKWYRTADEMNEAVFPLLERARESRRPLFLFLNYMDAHDPYLPPAPFDDRFPGRADDISHDRYVRDARAMLRGERMLTARERAHAVSQYDGEIAYLDSRLERLFERLKRLALFDRALIVVTSDHGEAFGEHDLVHHGVSVYQDQVFVPLLVKYPRSVGARTVSVPVSVVDLMPTILRAAGQPLPADLDGVSLTDPGPGSARLLISESYPAGDIRALGPRFDRVVRAAFADRFKLIVSSNGHRELYDLRADPGEGNDLSESSAAEADALEARFVSWLDTVATEIRQATELDADVEERLRALGYVH